MSRLSGVEQDYPARTRAQLRQAAEIMGINEDYILRMTRFFVARVAADRQLGKTCAIHAGCVGEGQVERMTAFFSSIAFLTDRYDGDLVAVHRNLGELSAQDFARWLELFRATLDETAPTPLAASFLMRRTERIAHDLEAALRASPRRSERSRCVSRRRG